VQVRPSLLDCELEATAKGGDHRPRAVQRRVVDVALAPPLERIRRGWAILGMMVMVAMVPRPVRGEHA